MTTKSGGSVANMGLPCDDIDNFMIEQIKNL